MKIVKGKFADHNKASESAKKKQKPQEQENTAYSKMLLDLVQPYLKPVPHTQDHVEDMLQLGIVGWNMAVSQEMHIPGFKELFTATIETAGISESDTLIVKEIMKKKQDRYPDYDNLIEDFEISEDEKGEPILSVASKSFVDYLLDLEMEEDSLEDMQYEEGYVNRNAILVKPKPAYWNWFKEFDKDIDESVLQDESTVYLVQEQHTDADIQKWVKKNFDRIFIHELHAWITDETCWPKKRTYKMFTDFFEVTCHGMVMDLENELVIKD